MTIRSENNDKFAQPDGLWIGAKGTPTNVSFAGPELKGAQNVVIPKIDHRETSYSPLAFDAAYRFITGKAPKTTAIEPEANLMLDGQITGMGVKSEDPGSGNFVNNLPIVQAKLEVFAIDSVAGTRKGAAVHSKVVGADGRYGPFAAKAGERYEFVVTAAGYATTHFYRSAFPRSSSIVHLRPERIAEAEKDAKSIAIFTRPRGYFDASRDQMSFDGQTPPPGLPPAGAGLAVSKIKYSLPTARSVSASFNGEMVVGQLWSREENHVTILELHQ
jgi:hypothetical protein